MPVSISSGGEAFSTAQQNLFSRWYRQGAQADEPQGQLAFQRLGQPLFTPRVTPAFKIRRNDKLFAIGSCFARGIEKALLSRQMEVASAAKEFQALETTGPQVTGLGFTNKYNTFAIRNELEWALDPKARFPEQSIVELADGVCYDPHTNPTLLPASREETSRRRSLLQQVTARISDCRVVILTLGLVELWRDTVADVFLNTTPPAEAMRANPGRYQFQVSTFAENLENLDAIYCLLQSFGHRDAQIVVTVSPVPLMTTFTEQDVVIANCYSKSLLRAVAQEWAAAHANVHYFPSYEIVLYSNRAITWMEDLRHVQGKVVNHIMELFLASYIE